MNPAIIWIIAGLFFVFTIFLWRRNLEIIATIDKLKSSLASLEYDTGSPDALQVFIYIESHYDIIIRHKLSNKNLEDLRNRAIRSLSICIRNLERTAVDLCDRRDSIKKNPDPSDRHESREFDELEKSIENINNMLVKLKQDLIVISIA